MGQCFITRRGGTDVSDADATEIQVLEGATFFAGEDNEIRTGTIPKKTSQIYTPGTVDQIIDYGQYLSGDQTILGDDQLVADNIKSGIDIFGVAGKSSVVETADGTATAAQILAGKIAYANGAKITGIMVDRGAVAPSALNAGGSYTIPAGYHNGAGVVPTNTLASQTSGTAAAAQILAGYTSWTNGVLRTGTMTNRGAWTGSRTSNGNTTIPAGYHNGSGYVTTNTPVRRYILTTATWQPNGTLGFSTGFPALMATCRANHGGYWYYAALDPWDHSLCTWVKAGHAGVHQAAYRESTAVFFTAFGDGVATAGSYAAIAMG